MPIGTLESRDRIVRFNTKDHTFQELAPALNMGLRGHKCAFIPNNNKIMVTGGYTKSWPSRYLNSAVVLDLDDGRVTRTSLSLMNSIRYEHGMGVLTINGEDRLAVFGGLGGQVNDPDGNKPLATVEVYNAKTKKWETTDIKLKGPKHSFGFLSLKLSDIISDFS